MLKKELFRVDENGVELYIQYSDEGYYIENQNGALYVDAVNDLSSTDVFKESDVKIQKKNPPPWALARMK